jgi:hypothetical protein
MVNWGSWVVSGFGVLFILFAVYITIVSHDLTALILGAVVGGVFIWLGSRLRARAERSEKVNQQREAVMRQFDGQLEESGRRSQAPAVSANSPPPSPTGPVVINVPSPKVLMKCSHCGNIYDITLGRCDRCGAPAG